MKSLSVLVDDSDHRKFYSIKYTFIRQGEITISNNEIFKRILDEYQANHPEIVEIPDFTYDNYIKKARSAGDKRTATVRRNKKIRQAKEE